MEKWMVIPVLAFISLILYVSDGHWLAIIGSVFTFICYLAMTQDYDEEGRSAKRRAQETTNRKET